MTGWHEGPLLGFDTETTGVDPETARIVTAAVIQRFPRDWHGPRRPLDDDASWLVNPGVEIPAEASAIHGITTERAQADGMHPARAVMQIADRLTRAAAQRIPIVIYNAPYDLTVLDRECRRHGCETLDLTGALVIDPLVLDKHLDPYRKGKRTLTAACEHYQVTLDDAHEAGSDAIAAMRVAWRIATMFPEIAEMRPSELHQLQVRAKAVQSTSFEDYLKRQGKPEVIDPSWPVRAYETQLALAPT